MFYKNSSWCIYFKDGEIAYHDGSFDQGIVINDLSLRYTKITEEEYLNNCLLVNLLGLEDGISLGNYYGLIVNESNIQIGCKIFNYNDIKAFVKYFNGDNTALSHVLRYENTTIEKLINEYKTSFTYSEIYFIANLFINYVK